jgi:hypothetical protein
VECCVRMIRRGTNELSHIWMRTSPGSCGNRVKDLSILSEESARARFPKCSALELTSDAILGFGIGNFDALGNDRGSGGCFYLFWDSGFWRWIAGISVMSSLPCLLGRLKPVNPKFLDP